MNTSELSDLANLEKHDAERVIASVLERCPQHLACFTCSFQAEDMIVLQLLRDRLLRIPVLFLDTGYHFRETYEFRDRVAREWDLNLINLVAAKTIQEQEAEFGVLYRENPTNCCQLRKVEPLMRGLELYEIWFTGLRREQSPTRQNLKKAEIHRLPSGKDLLKVSPLADWTWKEVWEYTAANRLPYLPHYDRGYFSIGCEPCTTLPIDPQNPRSGRWSGKKLECGIHTFSERAE